MLTDAALIVAGYLLGSLPWGYWLPLWLRHIDIRTVGSGNVGASNVARELGVRYGIVVALLDILKGVAAALLGTYLGGEVVGVLAGTAALVGHWRPLFLGFGRGGKVVAVTGGVALALVPIAAVGALGVWLIVFLTTRYASVASLAAAVALPLFAWAADAGWPELAFAGGAGFAIVALHRGNVQRLLRGEERRAEGSLRARLRGRHEASA